MLKDAKSQNMNLKSQNIGSKSFFFTADSTYIKTLCIILDLSFIIIMFS